MRIAALIFDMDDLLIHSAPTWTAAEKVLLDRIGYPYTPELAQKYKGMNALDVARTIHQIARPTLPLELCQKIMRDALIERFSGSIEPMPGAVELVRRLQPLRPCAVASGSPLQAIERAMERLGLRGGFRHLISSESVPRGKPHPDVFLAAADALGVAPAECVVFEDSIHGVQAGIAAGMTVYAVPSTPVAAAEIPKLTPHVYRSLAEILFAFEQG